MEVSYKLVHNADCFMPMQVTPVASSPASSAESEPECDFDEVDGDQDIQHVELKEQLQTEV